ncbi:hypothetical protein [Paenibacillus amylolyticus]|nr:hypothetical protein [Paenibacillus amylolyticus]MCL6660534.1 hypothetical protein [Paenibacillus amylolyticus]
MKRIKRMPKVRPDMDEAEFCWMFAQSNLKKQSKKGFDLTIESLFSFSIQ